jgi:hypothetical protein
VLYRVAAAAGLGADGHVVGYTQRPLSAVSLAPLPTLTAAPTASPAPTLAPAASLTPLPTLDLNAPAAPAVGAGGQWKIAVILAVMLGIAGLAFLRLQRRR